MRNKGSFVTFVRIPAIWAFALGLVGFIAGLAAATITEPDKALTVVTPWLSLIAGLTFGGFTGLVANSLDLPKSAHKKGILISSVLLTVAILLVAL